MFSQFRHAVENLAQSPRSSQDMSGAGPGEDASVRSSVDDIGPSSSQSPSSQLAESALSSLKKTLVTQRPGSPSLRTQAAYSEPTPTPAPKPRPGRSTLEDRLRAKFAIGDISANGTPITSSRASPLPSPSPVLVADRPPTPSQTQGIPEVKGPANPLSPTSIPLPDSTASSPTATTEPPVSLHAAVNRISAHVALSSHSSTLSDKPEPLLGEAEADSSGEEGTSDPLKVTTQTIPSWEHPTPETDASSSPKQTSPSEIDAGDASAVVDIVSEPEMATASSATGTRTPPPSEAPQLASPSHTNDASQNDSSDSMDASVPTPSDARSFVEVATEDVTAESTMSTPSQGASSAVPSSPDDGPAEDTETPQLTASNGSVLSGIDVEALQKRLKLVEQRFTDVSTSFKRLQAEKLAVDRVLHELTSVESVTEVEALRDFLQNMGLKTEMAQDEIRRLNGKLTRQDERIEELRDIHHLESKSQSDQIEKLKAQLEESEKLLRATHESTSQTELESAKQKAEVERLRGEVSKVANEAKEEEEKRTKAIALLKTVRQKLVKAEKERDDTLKEIGSLKEAEKVEREKSLSERAKLQGEIEKVNMEREAAVQGLRAQFDKEVAVLKDRQEKELLALRGQFELEGITTKTTHMREIESKKARIGDLEKTVTVLSSEKDELFDQLQLRQAELESSQSSLESLEGQNTELRYQLRETQDRVALLQEEFTDARREQDIKVQSSGPSPEEVNRLLAAAESKYEGKLSDLRRRLVDAERERDEGEAHWSKKRAEQAREVDSLKKVINSSQQRKAEELEGAEVLKQEIEALKDEIRSYQKQITDLRAELEKAVEAEANGKEHLVELSSKAADLQQSVDESRNREVQLRTQSKTLREELRKVQSSVALLEKQRGPGLGYWASRNESMSEIRTPRSSVSDLAARETPSRPASPASTVKSEEEVNFEYLRNIILQFLEHKEMRPHLVRIMSTILRFTPQETRRLIAKV